MVSMSGESRQFVALVALCDSLCDMSGMSHVSLVELLDCYASEEEEEGVDAMDIVGEDSEFGEDEGEA
jgi:hypothetical protein